MEVISSKNTIIEGESRVVIISWDRRNLREAAEAKKAFEDYIRQGWFAFVTTPDNRSVQVFEFDLEFGRVFLYPLAEDG